jgi:hypothetical protein
MVSGGVLSLSMDRLMQMSVPSILMGKTEKPNSIRQPKPRAQTEGPNRGEQIVFRSEASTVADASKWASQFMRITDPTAIVVATL